ncbi:MAG TPA: hypothetical protein VGI91_01880 [Steroidobacteraceae bacterium]
MCDAGVDPGCTEHYTAADEVTSAFSAQDRERAPEMAAAIQKNLQSGDPARLRQYLPP